MKSCFWNRFYTIALSASLFLMPISNVNASTVSYSLDNVFLNLSDKMTGSFDWTYSDGDFENGTGVFTELFIPFTTKTTADINITFDIKKSIEFTLKQNLDNDGLDITLVFQSPLTATTSSLLDLNTSSWSIGARGFKNTIKSGSIAPAVIPIPTAVLLFGSGLLGLIRIKRSQL